MAEGSKNHMPLRAVQGFPAVGERKRKKRIPPAYAGGIL
jgi:hypothetical protein